MPDYARLKQLTEEAKTRHQEQGDKQLGEFRSRLEGALSTELCNILAMSFSVDSQGQRPTAAFQLYNANWTIRPSDDNNWNLRVSHTGDPDDQIPTGFKTKDELLLLIDKVSQHAGRR